MKIQKSEKSIVNLGNTVKILKYVLKTGEIGATYSLFQAETDILLDAVF